MTSRMHPLTETELAAYLAGHRAFEGVVETPDGATAPMTYERLVTAIGGGFHPDTRGHDYVTLPEGVTPELVERVVNEAFRAHLDGEGPDPYQAGLDLALASDH